MSVQKVHDHNFHTETAAGIVLADFSAAWCAPCRTLNPILDQLAEEYSGQVRILKIDVDEAPAVSAEYGIMSMPTVLLFQDGQPVDKLVGLRPKNQYQALLQRALSTARA